MSRLIQTDDWRSSWDGALREDQDLYENGLKRSSDAKVMTILEMRSDGYGPNIKVSPFDDTELPHFEHSSI